MEILGRSTAHLFLGVRVKAVPQGLGEKKGIVPFVTSHLKGRFFVFFTEGFLLFLATAGGSYPAGPIT